MSVGAYKTMLLNAFYDLDAFRQDWIDGLLIDLQILRNTREGIIMFLSGRKIGVSTSIADTTTYGYGKLDFNGYWEFPVPEIVVDCVQEMRDEIEDLKNKLKEKEISNA